MDEVRTFGLTASGGLAVIHDDVGVTILGGYKVVGSALVHSLLAGSPG